MTSNLTLEQLNRQAIAAAQLRMGHFAWGTVALVIGVVGAYIGNLWLFAHGVLPAWGASLLLAALTYGSYTPLHEAAHGNINGRNERFRWVNELCGFLCAPMIMLPHSSHRLEHMNHHRYTNDPARDPDCHIQSMSDGPWGFFIAPWRLLWIHVTYIFRDHWQSRATIGEKCRYAAEIAFSLGWRITFLTQVPLAAGLMVIVGGYAAGAFFTVYWFAYQPHRPYDKIGRYVDTASLIVPRWLKPFEWIWLGQTLHSIHHAFPRVPFYRYHGLFREVESAMRAHGGQVIDLVTREPVAATNR
ncbi:fatty acid desaturase [uncultured Nevskia sp.]|jgi:beta-carotene hydroxylase|uniref:fatty acid desaturase family protein n=1 Tax=uncultured Nevskia sp. TaxID=228950 RepID=UPI0025CE1630|nr:fatty acid desaturase [uncultured Nevskia sp.]